MLDTAKRAIDTQITDNERYFVRKMLISKVQEWNPSAEHALCNLERLRNTMDCQLTTRDLHKDFFTGVAGAWITWNLTNKEPISDEHAIMSLLGNALVDGLGTDHLWVTVKS